MSEMYTIPTKIGGRYTPVYWNENAIPSNLPGNLVMVIDQPMPQTVNTGRALVVYPVSQSPYVNTSSGERIHVDDFKPFVGDVIEETAQGIPIILGEPIPMHKVKYPEHISYLHFPELEQQMGVKRPGIAQFIVIAIVILVAVSVAIAGISYALTTLEQERTKQHMADLVFQSQQVVNRKSEDINGDGVDDVEWLEYGNGDLYGVALNDDGKTFLGGTTSLEREGIDFAELYNKLLSTYDYGWIKDAVMWIAVAAIVIGAIVIVVRIIPPLPAFKRSSTQQSLSS